MKRFLSATLLLIGTYVCASPTGYIQPSDRPNAAQQKMLARGYGMFIHFGINTFSGEEWTDGTLEPSLYNPKTLDTDQWAKTAKDAGMRYVILISKHHDGFCLWDSKHTSYDVGSSPVNTDVVKAMAKSCKEQGLKLGLYYSLWDRNWDAGVMRKGGGLASDLTDAQNDAYVDYMCNQLTELLSNYGEVCELWLDGGWVLPREDWQIERVYQLVKKLQPDCLVSSNWTIGKQGNPDFHTVQPKDYKKGQPIRYFPSDFRLGDPKLPEFPDVKQFSGPDNKLYYLPFETTVCLNKHWFWQPYDKTLQSVDKLERLYEHTTAQNNVLILNSPPNRDGLMPEHNVIRLREMAERLGANPSKPIPVNLAAHATAQADSVWENNPVYNAMAAIDGNPATRWAAAKNKTSLTITLPAVAQIDRVRIREYEESGAFRTQQFVLDAFVGDTWQEIYTGNTLGSSRLLRFAPCQTDHLRLRITEASAPPSFWHISIHATDTRAK